MTAVPRSDARTLFAMSGPGVAAGVDTGFAGALTWLVPGGTDENGRWREPLVVRVAQTAEGAERVEREARILVELRRLGLGRLAATIPRHVGTRQLDGLSVTASSAVPGDPLPSRPGRNGVSARLARAQADLAVTGFWLAELQAATAAGVQAHDWSGDVAGALVERWRERPGLAAELAAALRAVERAGRRLAGPELPVTVVHGDFRPENVRVDAGAVSGVVGWADATLTGCPLRDVARFVLAHACARGGSRCGIRPALLGRGRYARLVRAHLSDQLERLGARPGFGYDVAVLGLAELAAAGAGERQAAVHLRVLADLPLPSS